MKCRVCRQPAVIDVPRHNANFCGPHFLDMCRRQVVKAIEDFDMLAKDDRILIAVSGGKDSLAVWDILLDLGYEADGLYIGLGIGSYSDVSGEYARAFATERGLKLIEVSLRDGVRLRRADSDGGHPAGAVLGVRDEQAAPVRQGRDRWQLLRSRHRS